MTTATATASRRVAATTDARRVARARAMRTTTTRRARARRATRRATRKREDATTTTTTARDARGARATTRRGVARAIAGGAVMGAAMGGGRGGAARGGTTRGVAELTPENFEREVTKSAGGGVRGVLRAVVSVLQAVGTDLGGRCRKARGSGVEDARGEDERGRVRGLRERVRRPPGFPTLMLFENGRPVGAKTGLVDMTTAMKYAGVRDEGVLAKFAPEKKLDKILSGAQVEYVQGELGEVRKGIGRDTRPGVARARAGSAATGGVHRRREVALACAACYLSCCYLKRNSNAV